MAGSTVTIKIDDADYVDLLRYLRRNASQGNTGDLTYRLGEYLQEATQRRFYSQVAPDGEKWKELSPRYAKSKRQQKDKILTLRGYLRRSIRFQQLSPTSVEVGTNVPYAAVHQFGASWQRQAKTGYQSVAKRVLFGKQTANGIVAKKATPYSVEIKARPFLGINADDESRIREIIADWHRDQHVR